MKRSWLPTSLVVLLLAWLPAGCAEDAGTAPDIERSTPPAESPASGVDIRRAEAGTLVVTDASGATAFTLRLDGSHVELTSADGERLVGEQRGDKRRYRRASDGAEVFEVKQGDNGFKLRTPDSRLLWKVRFGEDKLKVSDNEQNERPWVLKTGYDDKAKVLAPDEREVGTVRFGDGRTKVKDAEGNERYVIDTQLRSPAFGVTLMESIPAPQRAILMLELLARDR